MALGALIKCSFVCSELGFEFGDAAYIGLLCRIQTTDLSVSRR